MGPNNSGTPNFNQAPRPSQGNFNNFPDFSPQYNVEKKSTGNTYESGFNQAPLKADQAPSGEQLVPPPAIPVVNPPITTSTTTTTTQQAVLPTSQQDIDKMEKEWVNKAKSAINSNKNNPYEQAHQISLLMKGYLQNRYGKSIGK